MRLLIPKKYYYTNGIYMIKCTNGMKYIGSVCRVKSPYSGLYSRYKQYFKNPKKNFNVKILNCIKKYGFDSLSMSLIKPLNCKNFKKIRKLEEYYIKKYKTYNTKNGLNLKPFGAGGNGGANLGKKYPKQSAKTIALRVKKLKGIPKPPRSKIHCQRLSEAHKGSPCRNGLNFKLRIKFKNKIYNFNSVREMSNELNIPHNRIYYALELNRNYINPGAEVIFSRRTNGQHQVKKLQLEE